MKPVMRLCFFLVMLSITQAVTAQHAPLDFNLIKKYNGITIGKINSITQDRNGYMWFADKGNDQLIRFDGYKMKRYKYDPADSNSLDRGANECVAVDSIGCVWTNAVSGIDKFDPVTNKFTHYRYKQTESRSISNILIDHLGIVWIGTSAGLDRLDQTTGNFVHYTHNDNDNTSLSYNTVRCLYEDHEGILWVGTGWEFDPAVKGGGLNRFNRETGKFTRYMHDPNNPHSLAGDKVRAIFEDSRGVFWVGTDGDGLHIMDRKTGTFERLSYDPMHPEKLSRPPLVTGRDWADHITFIAEDGAAKIWVGTFYAGIICYDPVTKEITHYDSTDKSRPKGFTDNSTWCAFTSRDGVLWISTQGEENLFRIDPLQTSVSLVNMGDDVEDIYEDSSGITWICFASKGLLKINPYKNEKKYFVHNPTDPYSISKSHVTFIKPDTNGFFWVGTFNGLNHFDSKTGKFTRYLYNEISKGDFKDTAIFTVLKSDNGEIYVTTNLGFLKMNPKTGLMKRYESNPADTTSMSNNFSTGLCKDKSGNVWIGTWSIDGLNLLDIKTNKFKHYLRSMTTTNIYQDNAGTIWVGTSNGLYYFNDSTKSFIPVEGKGTEFRTAFVYSLGWEDEEKNIWGFSSLGVFRINHAKNELSVYGIKFGIDKKDFSNLMKLRDGRLAVKKDGGYYAFYPKNLLNHAPPQITITDFKINGKSVTPGKNAAFKGSSEEAKEIHLQYNQNSFSIDFAAIHYSSPEDNISYYMLEGYDTNWIKSDSSNAVEYRNIPTGKYLFKIKARSSYGVWSTREVNIIISPPWWLTWWAFTLFALALFLVVWGIIKWRTSAIEKEKVILEERVAQRTLELKKEKEIVESTLTELRSTQSQLIQSEKMASLGELTAGIAHEIQNPLNFVNNFSEVNTELIDELGQQIDKGNLDEVKAIAKDIKENEEKINHHGKRADAIVKGMLQHSRSSTGVKEPTDINALADEYLRLSYHGLRAKDNSFNATMNTDFDNSIGKINIIPHEIGRVLLNLYNNAFYAVSEKKKSAGPGYEPTVSVSTKKMGEKVEIRVKDNGNGIPAKVLDKIFQPFFTTKPTGQGTGLGLSLSYDIIKAHGGEIKVNTSEGEFTEFIIELPA
jgi:signal transduction histidine kinase/ligand-binding sensor domain-containing protein